MRFPILAVLLSMPLVAFAAPPTVLEAPVPGFDSPVASTQENSAKVFATAGGIQITADQFFMAVQEGVRKKYYHGKIHAAEMAKFQREIGKKLVTEHLLAQEATRKGLKADESKIDSVVAQFDGRYGSNPEWQKDREKMLKPVIDGLRRKDLIAQLEALVRDVPEPKEADVKLFYAKNKDKFTEPPENKISTILLRVDPSAGSPAWEEARLKAEDLVAQIRKGASFAELSKQHSGDKSAAKGGKMGYLHKGMLAPAAEEALEKMKVGEITDPLMVLEGMAIFLLEDKVPAELLAFDKVQKRATNLLRKEQGEVAWTALQARLWAQGSVNINETLYLPLQEEKPSASTEVSKTGATTPVNKPAASSVKKSEAAASHGKKSDTVAGGGKK